MEYNQAHSIPHALLHARYNFVGDLVMRHVSPPDKYVGILEYFPGKTVFRLVKGCGAYLYIFLFAQGRRDGLVNALGIDLRDLGGCAFVTKFVPDGDSNGCHRKSLLSVSFHGLAYP